MMKNKFRLYKQQLESGGGCTESICRPAVVKSMAASGRRLEPDRRSIIL